MTDLIARLEAAPEGLRELDGEIAVSIEARAEKPVAGDGGKG